MRWLSIIFALFFWGGCVPSIYSVDGLRTLRVVFTFDDGSQLQADVDRLTERTIMLRNVAAVGGEATSDPTVMEISRARIVKAVDTRGNDVTVHYRALTPSELAQMRMADLASRSFNVTVAFLVLSVATSIAAFSAASGK